jgi:RNA polymerase sigma-70 factor (ECF subfamily)
MSVAVAAAESPLSIALSAIESRTVVAAQAGDVEARETLARSCQVAAYRFALHLTGNRDDALELSQDAMVRFFGSLARFDAARPVRPWLLRIVRNLVRDRARRLRVRRVEPLENEDGSMVIEPIDPGPTPEQTTRRAEVQRRLWAAVQSLTPKHREVIALRDYLDLSYDEIAEILKIPRGTVMSRLHRARIRLKKELSGQLRKEVVS